jgi:ComF family protein
MEEALVSSEQGIRGIVRVGRSVGDSVLEALCPTRCLACGQLGVRAGEQLCTTCLAALRRHTAKAYCPRCGHTAAPFALREAGCGKCVGKRLPYGRVIRVAAYQGAFASLLRLFKFGGREELLAYFAAELAGRIARADIYEDIDALLAVPTCWRHRLRRRFHPAEALAERMSRQLYIPVAPVLLRRGGKHQVGLSVRARIENVRGQFRLATGCAIRGAKLCLVDDVTTSGATAAECSRVLKRAGASVLCVAVLAKAADDAHTLLQV